jgi:N-acetylmuramoyl-L-alanine amidase
VRFRDPDSPASVSSARPLRAGVRRIVAMVASGVLLASTLIGAAHAAAHKQTRPLIVVLDPGHGGPMHWGDESGAVDLSGTLMEKQMTLKVGLLAASYLRGMGYTVYLTRTGDQHVNIPPRDLNHDGTINHIDEFDARTLFANHRHADVFVSIHFDGNGDTSLHGTHGYYCPARPFWKSSKRLAGLLTTSVASQITRAGYRDPNNGIETDVADKVPQSRADYPWFLVLGPSRPHWLTGTAMPGALIETLFMSNPADDAAMRKSAVVAAMAHGYANGIRQYFNGRTTTTK